MRIYTTKTDTHGDGHYSFHIFDTQSAYVSSIVWGGVIDGWGAGVENVNGMIGSSPDGNYARLHGESYPDVAAIIGKMSSQQSGTNHIYVHAYLPTGTNAYVAVYVSQNNNYDWTLVNGLNIAGSSTPQTIDFGTTTVNFRYVCVCLMVYIQVYFDVDCLISS
ncbi:hypothetical protein JW988_01155 [Candidatus Bathyarchaeota archaeon]|nr:hypothetical protein [Candidatus Bathyarchaeota archaeon]